MLRRAYRSAWNRARSIRAHPNLNPLCRVEMAAERTGGHPVDPRHGPHLRAAAEWLSRAQDATADGGVARGFSLGWNPYFRQRGWQPSYPETTGYIIPTFLALSPRLGAPSFRRRALEAARWEVEIQLDSGGVQGGVVGQGRSPVAFNTGQVILGWLGAHRETGESAFGEAIHRAGRFLQETQSADGMWHRSSSRFARQDSTLYNARTGWALIAAGADSGETGLSATGARALDATARHQHGNGWIPHCCLVDPDHPVLHTLAYAYRGLLEGGVLLGHEPFVESAARGAKALARQVDERGWMAGRFSRSWEAAAPWACLTGQAQMVNVWLRLHEVTGDTLWLEPVEPVLGFLKSTQNRGAREGGLRGGIKGSHPVGGGYGPHEILSWATKFFVDALLRAELAFEGTKARSGADSGSSPGIPSIV